MPLQYTFLCVIFYYPDQSHVNSLIVPMQMYLNVRRIVIHKLSSQTGSFPTCCVASEKSVKTIGLLLYIQSAVYDPPWKFAQINWLPVIVADHLKLLFCRLCTLIVSALKWANSIKESSKYFPGFHLLGEKSIVTAPSRKLSEVKAMVRDISGTEQGTNAICAQGKQKTD